MGAAGGDLHCTLSQTRPLTSSGPGVFCDRMRPSGCSPKIPGGLQAPRGQGVCFSDTQWALKKRLSTDSMLFWTQGRICCKR